MPKPANTNRRTLFVMAAIVLVLPLLATGFNKLIQPQRHAEAARCLDAAVNQCDFAIIAAYCARGDGQDRNGDACARQRLEPGETFTDTPPALAEGPRYQMACKAPFDPKWGPSLSNASLQQKRCARPGQAR